MTSMYLATIRERAAKNPSALAVITKSNSITYGELVGRVETLATELSRRKAGPELPVAVCSGKSIDWVVGLLAVLCAGGKYIPVDPLLPLQRKLQMLKDSGVDIILTESAFAAMFPDSAAVMTLNDRAPVSGSGKVVAEIAASECAYANFTSGSTGDPLTVSISHGSIDACAAALRAELRLTADDRFLHSASISFCASMRQLIVPLVSGAAVVIASREEAQDMDVLVTNMIRSGVTVFDTLPSHLARWLETVANAPRQLRDQLSSRLRLVLTTGEVLSAQTVDRLRKLFPAVRMLSLYGQAETAGAVAVYEVGKTIGRPMPIGRPLGGNQLYVLDGNLRPSLEGELHVAGPCVALEYPGRADLTARRLILNPVDSQQGARLYRTGDRVRRIEGGDLIFLGRNDDLVEVNGIRVDLGEVDALLKTHDDILDSATVLRPVGGGAPRLVSFVVARAGQSSPSADRLKGHLAHCMSKEAIPSLFVGVAEIPRAPSGKISRPALCLCDLNLDARQVSGESPRTGVEQMVASAWEEMLGVTPIGVEDDFFALGGDSLQALAMVSQLQKKLPLQLPLAGYFFQEPTLRAFAGAIETALAALGATAVEAKAPELALAPRSVESEPELSLSRAQLSEVSPPGDSPASSLSEGSERQHSTGLLFESAVLRIKAKVRMTIQATTLSDLSVRLVERCHGIRYPDRLIGRRNVDATPARQGGILVVAAHPDDESLGLGLTLIDHRMRGDDVTAIFTTNGAGGDWNDRKHDQETLSAKRITEAHQALGVIGIQPSNILNLGFPDGGLHRYVAAAGRDIATLLKLWAPARIYVHAIEGGHIDHDMTSFIVQSVSLRLGITEVYEWAEYNRHVSPGSRITHARFPSDPYLPEFDTSRTPIKRECAAKKQEMLQKYASQGTHVRAYPFEDEVLRKANPAHLLQRLEYFTRMPGRRLRALCAGVVNNPAMGRFATASK